MENKIGFRMASFTFELGMLGGVEAGHSEPVEWRVRDSVALADVRSHSLAQTSHGLVFVCRP